jgi:hypothetical protein
MGDEPSRRPMMTRVCWRLVDILSLMLHPDECDVVRGDLAESGAAGSQALRDVLGLVVRRQAAPWMHWRPWLTLVSLVVPLGMLLSVTSRGTADGSAVYGCTQTTGNEVILGTSGFGMCLPRLWRLSSRGT